MGNQKQKWTGEEEDALKAGVAKHGPGKWKNILVDPEFASQLANRSNVDLKDKWRNMGAGFGRGSISSSKAKESMVLAVVTKIRKESSPPRSPKDAKNGLKYSAMIFEAISLLKEPSGSDLGAIVGFIEKKYAVPHNFRRQLSLRLRRLVLQGKLVKVLHRFKIKDASFGSKPPNSKKKHSKTKQAHVSSPRVSQETLTEAANLAAQFIAEAENNTVIAAEAVKEYERVLQMAENADAMLIFYEALAEHCISGGQLFIR